MDILLLLYETLGLFGVSVTWKNNHMEPALANFDESFEDGDDFDDSKLPSSGYEYLRRVQ